MFTRPTLTATLLASTILLLAGPRPAGAQPQAFDLYGVAWDFKKAHPDFNVSPIDGEGHYAANVAYALGADGQPIFAGGGFKVATQWTNSGEQPIAPHLFMEAGIAGSIKLVNSPSVNGNATLDTWDSSAGPYGGGNVGPAPGFEVGAGMPVIVEPQGLGPSQGDVGLSATTLDSDLHCDDLTISGTVQVAGSVTVLCEGGLTMATHSDLELQPGATLKLYVKTGVTVMPHANLNAPPVSGLPALVTIYHMGTQDIRLSQPNGVVFATVVAPFATMLVMPNSEFFGTFTGKDLVIKANAGFHADTGSGLGFDACGNPINDHLGGPAVTSNGAITSPDTFAQWYHDVFGVNLAKSERIKLVNDGTGVFEFIDDAFYPLDGLLFGNEGDSHNYDFTFTVEAQFDYEACAGQFIELSGSDDIWLFVDGQLAIDLGGVIPGTQQVIEMDRLGLADGGTYPVTFFYAQRQGQESRLHFRTNIELFSQYEVVNVSWACD